MKLFRHLYVWVLIAIVSGALFGHYCPERAIAFKTLSDGFVKLVKMLIGPIIFCTIVTGIGTIGNLHKVGRVGLKALLYFEVITTAALFIGLVVVNYVKPGSNIHAGISDADIKSASTYAGKHLNTVDFVLNIIPETFAGALTSGEILQVLFIAILSGVALSQLGVKARPIIHALEIGSAAFMRMVGMLMKLSPLAAFGGIAFTTAKSGFDSLLSLARLMGCVYATMLIFICVVLGSIMRMNKLSLWKFLLYIREELLLVLGTSSSESALPGMVGKMERLGCSKSVVGLVLPAGYSFNLDGTCIYLTMAAIFIAQATDTVLSLPQQLEIVGLLLLTSKGAAAVTGGGFITLSATLSSTRVPVSGLSLLIGVDRFMSEARSLTNLIGNGVATITVANWENELDLAQAKHVLAGGTVEAKPPGQAAA